MEKINILIVDDHDIVIDGVKLMLDSVEELCCVATAHNGRDALKILEENPIDVMLLDVNMPIMNGLETLKAIKKGKLQLKILILTMLQETSLIKLMLKNGADGFVLKNTGKEELISAIKQVHAGERFLGKAASSMILNSVGISKTKKSFSIIPKLSRREKQILALIVDEFTTQEIADKLFISFGTVETHRRNILLKTGARNTAGLVRSALELNLLE